MHSLLQQIGKQRRSTKLNCICTHIYLIIHTWSVLRYVTFDPLQDSKMHPYEQNAVSSSLRGFKQIRIALSHYLITSISTFYLKLVTVHIRTSICNTYSKLHTLLGGALQARKLTDPASTISHN